MMKTLLAVFILFLCLNPNSLDAQEAKKRIAIYDIDITQSQGSMLKYLMGSSDQKSTLRSIPEYLIGYYSNSEQFITIDNIKKELIKDEKERQKSEEFIDGYVVDQGKQEGYDYIFYSRYFQKEKEVTIRVYDVANETVFCEVREPVNKTFGMVTKLNETSIRLIEKLNNSCFSIYIDVVRSLDTKSGKGTKKLLILAGTDQKVKKGSEFEILQKQIEKIGDKTYERYVNVGKGEISDIEDENFSVLQVKKGGGEIEALLKSNTPLFCRLSKR